MTIYDKALNRLQRLYLAALDDEAYARTKYRWRFGRELDLERPRLFSEKIQWLKLHDDNEGHGVYADKYGVRSVVASRLGERFLNELHFVLDDPEDLSEETLPGAFVLKATHGSGFNLICPDKASFDLPSAKRTLKRWLATDYAARSRERQYGAVPRRIVCEKYLSDDSGGLMDYKVLCCDGEPAVLWVDVDRYAGHKRAFFSVRWEPIDVTFNKYPQFTGRIERPGNLEEMLALSRELARGFPFARIDFYSLSGRTVFGEVTFHPASGFAEFSSPEFSASLADKIPTSGGGAR